MRNRRSVAAQLRVAICRGQQLTLQFHLLNVLCHVLEVDGDGRNLQVLYPLDSDQSEGALELLIVAASF